VVDQDEHAGLEAGICDEIPYEPDQPVGVRQPERRDRDVLRRASELDRIVHSVSLLTLRLTATGGNSPN
jgi:hypothetical protein